MKKIYLLMTTLGFIFTTSSFAQRIIAEANVIDITTVPSTLKNQPSVDLMNVKDTLTNHWNVIAPVPVDTPITYKAQSGFIGGQNNYGDLAKAQKFDTAYGVTSANGTITNLLLWFGGKTQDTSTAAFTATIWADSAGIPGAVLGTAPVFTIAQIDTSLAAIATIGPLSALKGMYNVTAVFSPAVVIPSNKTFWAGISFTYAKGDSAGLVTSTDGMAGDTTGATGNFPASLTHTFEQWSDNSWHSFNDGTNNSWQLDVALAIYPVLDFATGADEYNNTIHALYITPNPVRDNMNIHYELKEATDVEVTLFDLTGKKLLTLIHGVQSTGKQQLNVDVSNLSAGVYFYTISAGYFKATGKMTVVK